MAESTKISWCDSTFNPWTICTPVSPGCDNCYASAWAKRTGRGAYRSGVPRVLTSESNWRLPLIWNKKAEASGKRWLVFCASLADVFDNEVPAEWRHDLWQLIGVTPRLTWLLLTKRIGNAGRMLPCEIPGEWTHFPNVWLGASIVNQEEADRDIPKLLATPAAKRFVSYEPALEPVDFRPFMWPVHPCWPMPYRSAKEALAAGAEVRYERQALVWAGCTFLDWVIVGGESGRRARPFDVAWARSTVEQCKAAQVACFVKQLGANARHGGEDPRTLSTSLGLAHRAGADPAEWPIDLRVQETPA